MSIRLKYILFILSIHAVLVGLVYYALKDQKWYFLLSEIFIGISLYLSYLMYKAFIRPLDLLQSGTDAIASSDFSIKYLDTGSKEMDKLIAVFNTMIDRLREERTRMTEQSYFVQNLIDVTPIGILIMDFDGKISSINPAAMEILQLNKTKSISALAAINHPLRMELENLEIGIAKVISISGMDKYKCQLNEVIHLGFKRKFILIDDLSNEIIRSEKEAFGKIIRMMAHEVNNSMGAINSIIDSVIEFGFEKGKDDEFIQSLEIARERNISLNVFMANFASILRLPKAQMTRINLNEVLKKCGQLYTPIAAERDIQIEMSFSGPELNINGDAILLEQAISNILKNAIESIGTDGAIKIISNSKNKSFSIIDNGVGITKEDESKLFTPFYSTKTNGQGIGLMLIREIFTDHNARFSLKTNRETEWTNFKVQF